MKKEESLIEVKENIFSKFFKSMKSMIYKIFKKDTLESQNREELKKAQEEKAAKELLEKDMELLGKVVKGEVKASDVEPATKERLILLCKKRRLQVREKINKANETIAKLDKMMAEVDEVDNS